MKCELGDDCSYEPIRKTREFGTDDWIYDCGLHCVSCGGYLEPVGADSGAGWSKCLQCGTMQRGTEFV